MEAEPRNAAKPLLARHSGISRSGWACFIRAALTAISGFVQAESFTLSTPAGPVQVPLTHVDPGGSLLTPDAPSVPSFSAPTIFAAPLPSGSGARALGVAGAFTAVADDATAASWNPAGLMQLERPEFSLVYRLRHETNRHWSGDPDYRVGEDDFYGNALNYMSAVMPFRLLDRNMVFSLNYQEVFDFSQRFHADFTGRSSSRSQQVKSEASTPEPQDPVRYPAENGYVDVTRYLTTRRTTTLDQLLSSENLGKLEFEQEGSVQAITPAFAVEATPKLSFGAALNVYQEGLLGTPKIRSHTHARYSGTMDSRVNITDQRLTSGTYSYEGVYDIAPPFPDIPFGPVTGDLPDYSTTDARLEQTRISYTGTYDVEDRIDRFRGVNATLGSLWDVSERLTLGFCLDLPWTARAHQRKTVRSAVTVEDGSGTSVTSVQRESTDVTFEFPLYWAAGGVWRWNNRLSTSFDLSQTLWSQYAFKAEGQEKINPLDGSPYGDHSVDDCWSLRTGTEYLWVLANTEIPFRAGLSWEQRPAVGQPDQYWGISLGTGFSLGKGVNKVIIDIAYIYSWGNDVMGTLIPGQQDTLGTDVDRHDLFLSCIYHF